ncbi:MAG: T9SS type A sorting domain-containing protein [Chitinophagaceae bacterium]|nr:T9SS type A sorting domain-containing protein [Chitinophagaceae bacterium]
MTSKCTLLTLASIIAATLPVTTVRATNYNNNGTSTNYSLVAGDTLNIISGTYIGNITAFSRDAVISINPSSTFRPASIANAKGIILNYGTCQFNYAFNPNGYFTLTNHGIIKIRGSVSMNGGSQTWNNRFGAVLEFGENVIMNSGSVLNNEGTTLVDGDFNMNTGSAFTNRNIFSGNGDLTISSGVFANEGQLSTKGTLAFNSSTTFTNQCRLITEGGFTNNSNNFINLGLLWIGKTGSSADHFINNGNFINGPNGVVKSVRLTNNSNITGSGKMYFTGQTINYGTFGVSGSTTDTIKVYDVTRTSASTIFDVQYGTVRPNIIYRSFSAPDTVNAYGTCSATYRSGIALPVKWNAFSVSLVDEAASISWESEQEKGTHFEIERSYDGENFATIAIILSETNKIAYTFQDRLLNTTVPIVYYRVKGVELNGAKQYTETRTVRFTTKQEVAVQASPNPFTGSFNINFKSEAKSAVTIKLYSMTGQLVFTKNASANKGFNTFSITEASKLGRGMYMVQLSSNNQVVASEKIVKQ